MSVYTLTLQGMGAIFIGMLTIMGSVMILKKIFK